MKNEREQRGVTIMEMLVVIALISILVAIVFPSVGSGLGSLELRTSVQRVAAAARYARDQAIHRQRYYALEIDPEKGSVTVLDAERGSTRSFELPAAVRVEKILPEERQNTDQPRQILFGPDGAWPQFEVVLANQKREVTVSFDALTGAPKADGI